MFKSPLALGKPIKQQDSKDEVNRPPHNPNAEATKATMSAQADQPARTTETATPSAAGDGSIAPDAAGDADAVKPLAASLDQVNVGEAPSDVVSMGKPIEERNLIEHAVEYNPHRKTLEVFLMIGALVSVVGMLCYAAMSYALIETFFSSGPKQPIAESQFDICDDDACEEFEHRTMGFVKWGSNPCDSYFLYACSGFQKEAVDLNLAVYESHHDFISTEYELLVSASFTGEDDTPYGKELFEDFRRFYTECRTDDSYHFDLIDELETKLSTDSQLSLVTKYSDARDAYGDFFVFDVMLEENTSCYLLPPDMFFPHALFDTEGFRGDFIQAFIEYYQDALQPINEVLRGDIEAFFNFQRSLVEIMGDPKRQIYRPQFVQDMSDGLLKLVPPAIRTGCATPFVWVNQEYYRGLQSLIDKTSDVVLTNMIKFRLYLRMSLFGKRPTSLARLYYRYTHFMGDPPEVELRCLDALEPIFNLYYLDFLRRTHVFAHRDIPKDLTKHAQGELRRLVQAITRLLTRSALDDKDTAEANTRLNSLKIKLFYPTPLGDRYDSDSTKILATASIRTAQESPLLLVKAALTTLSNRRLALWATWPLSAFAHEPLYVPHQNTLYVPYSIFVWAYADYNSKLPFKIPVYGFKIVRELFKVFDYRSQWWVTKGTSSAQEYQKLENCVYDLVEAKYGINKTVERYETIAELAAVHLLHQMYTDKITKNKRQYSDIRLPFFKKVHSTTQFFIALASELCDRINVTTASTLNEIYGRKTAEQRLNMLAKLMPDFTAHFNCAQKSRMHVEKRYRECLFWR
ncbi:uncharacterized protein LOC144168495 [Haemaphysalis longicornis]